MHPATPITPAPATPAAGTATFADLGVPAVLTSELAKRGIRDPFPIQTATLPDALAGRDVLGRGRTGSGKTLAFAIPTVMRVMRSDSKRRPGRPRALVLVPTRELANQVLETLTLLTDALNLRGMTVYGGVSYGPQVSTLQRGVDVVVATPGRLEDLIAQGHVNLDAIEVTVIDEADHMADLGFLPAVKRILDRTPRSAQRLLFSATLDGDVNVIVRRYLTDPVTHSVDSSASEVPAMAHHVLTVSATDKPSVIRELLSGHGRILAFTRTKHSAKKLALKLTAAGIPSADLHGNLSQPARNRNLAAFHSGEVRVLVATDIAARGIHVDDVTLVVHIDPPAEHKAYLHRSGRTARAGAEGVVVTLATHEQHSDIRTLMRKAKISPTEHRVSPGHPALVALVGPPAPLVTAVRAPAAQSRPVSAAPRRRRSARRRSPGSSGR
jgi:superfamily II DNA/RNA helicase